MIYTYEEMVNFAKSRIVRICDMYAAIDDSKLLHPTFKDAFKSELSWIKKEAKNCAVGDAGKRDS